MTDPGYSVLIADADASVRRNLSSELSAMGLKVFEAADGGSALRTVEENDIRIVVCELYLPTGTHGDLISAIRSDKSLSRTRTVVHTRFLASSDRTWAKEAGADAYLIRPVVSARLRDVVSRVAARSASSPNRPESRRRDSLNTALTEIESGADRETRSIIVGRVWWTQLPSGDKASYKKRAKKTGTRLLSNPRLTDYVVEVRAPRRASDGPYSN
jgi:CheY-like chemotaxis protein